MLDRKEVIEKAMAFPMDQVVYRYQHNSSRFVLIFLYDLCRKALSKPISCPRSRLECHLHSENRSEAWSLQLWVSIGVELRPR